MRKKNRRPNRSSPARRRPPTPIVIGSDTELGNFLTGLECPLAGGTGYLASRLLLGEISGVPGWGPAFDTSRGERGEAPRGDEKDQPGLLVRDGDDVAADENTTVTVVNPRDVGRKWLPGNGGCCYIDLDHLELCTPEVRTAWDFVAAWHAMLRIARKAMQSVNEKLPQGVRAHVLVNNSDGLGNSYGGHVSFLISRRAWDNIFCHKPHYLAWLASYQASSIVFAGQGKVGAEHGRPAVAYQLSQRADFFETIVGPQTTFRRPIVNSRDEPLCGHVPRQAAIGHPGRRHARLHVIFYDSNLCHVANLLKVGVLQIILAMIEADRIHPGLILDEPLRAVARFSRDPNLRVRARTASGRRAGAVELQLRFLDAARRFYDRGGCDGLVPQADRLLNLWADTLEKLRARDFGALLGRLDWVLKRQILCRVIRQRPDLGWDSPEIKQLDHQYGNLDPSGGLYWSYERAGLIERVADDALIRKLVDEPPHNTRAWSRAKLLRLAGAERVAYVDWDSITFHNGTGDGWGRRELEFPEPAGHGQADAGTRIPPGQTLDELLGTFHPSGPFTLQTTPSASTVAGDRPSGALRLPGPERSAERGDNPSPAPCPTADHRLEAMEPEEGEPHAIP